MGKKAPRKPSTVEAGGEIAHDGRQERHFRESARTGRRQKLSELFAFRLRATEQLPADIAALCSRAEVYLLVLEHELEQSRKLISDIRGEISLGGYLIGEHRNPENSEAMLKLLDPEILRLIEVARKASKSAAGRKAATARYARGGPKAEAKRTVEECWRDWQKQPERYSSVAAFARDMLEKFPDELRSQHVVEGWSRDWTLRNTVRAD